MDTSMLAKVCLTLLITQEAASTATLVPGRQGLHCDPWSVLTSMFLLQGIGPKETCIYLGLNSFLVLKKTPDTPATGTEFESFFCETL